MKPLRVLYLTDNPNLGASVRTLLDWITDQASADLRFHVAVACPGPLADWLRDRRVPHFVSPMPWPDWRRPLTCVRSTARVAAAARSWQIDVVHAEHNVYPFAAPLARLLRRPVVCHVHYLVDRAYAEWALSGWRRPRHVLWTSEAQRAECREAVDGIIPDSDQSVVYLGVDLSRFGIQADSRDRLRQEWGATSDSIVIGAANALRPRKRVEDFIHLIDRLRSSDARVIGVLAGSAPPGDEAYEAAMRELHGRLGLDGKLLWLGNLEPIEPFMHAIDLFVSTSEHETFGMSICEAMACARPVAVYEGGSAGEVVGDAGRVVPTANLDALTAAVVGLLQGVGLRENLGRQARERVATAFSPTGSLAELGRLYRRLAEGRDGWSETKRRANAPEPPV